MSQQEILQLELSDRSIVRWQYTPISGSYEEVTSGKELKGKFQKVTQTIQSMAEDLNALYHAAKPSKMAIEFGLEISVESGELTALIVKGSGTANLKVTLEWEKGSEPNA